MSLLLPKSSVQILDIVAQIKLFVTSAGFPMRIALLCSHHQHLARSQYKIYSATLYSDHFQGSVLKL